MLHLTLRKMITLYYLVLNSTMLLQLSQYSIFCYISANLCHTYFNYCSKSGIFLSAIFVCKTHDYYVSCFSHFLGVCLHNLDAINVYSSTIKDKARWYKVLGKLIYQCTQFENRQIWRRFDTLSKQLQNIRTIHQSANMHCIFGHLEKFTFKAYYMYKWQIPLSTTLSQSGHLHWTESMALTECTFDLLLWSNVIDTQFLQKKTVTQ